MIKNHLRMNIPEGLTYHENIVPEELELRILEWYHTLELESVVPGGRCVKHFGYKYDYTARRPAEAIEPIPPILQELINLIPGGPILNQCILNRYLPGEGIASHIDRPEFGPVIACFTFMSGREMEFNIRSEDLGALRYTLYTTPGSLYVMSGLSRIAWKHQMRCRKSDVLFGITVARRECFSITFRQV